MSQNPRLITFTSALPVWAGVAVGGAIEAVGIGANAVSSASSVAGTVNP